MESRESQYTLRGSAANLSTEKTAILTRVEPQVLRHSPQRFIHGSPGRTLIQAPIQQQQSTTTTYLTQPLVQQQYIVQNPSDLSSNIILTEHHRIESSNPMINTSLHYNDSIINRSLLSEGKNNNINYMQVITPQYTYVNSNDYGMSGNSYQLGTQGETSNLNMYSVPQTPILQVRKEISFFDFYPFE